MDMMLRFLIGGIVVSVFAILGDVVKPESLGVCSPLRRPLRWLRWC